MASQELPTGTVTFLFTDLEDSTRLWEEFPQTMKSALAQHDAILQAAVEAEHGTIIKSTGDGRTSLTSGNPIIPQRYMNRHTYDGRSRT